MWPAYRAWTAGVLSAVHSFGMDGTQISLAEVYRGDRWPAR